VLPVLTRLPPVNLTGYLGYLGGAWVDPSLRGRGVMSLTLKLTVAHAVRLWPDVSKVFGCVSSNHIGLSLSDGDIGYGFSSVSRIDEMFLSGEATARTFYLVWTDDSILEERHSPSHFREIDIPRQRHPGVPKTIATWCAMARWKKQGLNDANHSLSRKSSVILFCFRAMP